MPLKRFILTAVIFLILPACVTVDEEGRPVGKPKDQDAEWSLNKTQPGPFWSERDLEVPEVYAGLPQTIPEIYRLPYLPPVGDQGSRLSGTAWAAGYTAMTVLERKQKIIGYICSPAFLYNVLNNGRDQGIETIDAVLLLKNSGCSDIDLMPYDEKYYKRQPSANAMESAKRHKAKGFGRVDSSDIDQVKAHLLQGSVVIATIFTTENFIKLDEKYWKVPKGRATGKQTVAVVGYNDKDNTFQIMNSAGENWGNGGFAFIPYRWFRRVVIQAYVIW